MSGKRRVYEELRAAIEERGGTMAFLRGGSRWGAWEVHLLGRAGRFESNGRGFPELDCLYAPGPHVKHPTHWSDYSSELVEGAMDKLMSKLV